MEMNILNTHFRLLRHRIDTHKNWKAAVLEQDYWEEIIMTYNVSRVLILAGTFSKVILEDIITDKKILRNHWYLYLNYTYFQNVKTLH